MPPRTSRAAALHLVAALLVYTGWLSITFVLSLFAEFAVWKSSEPSYAPLVAGAGAVGLTGSLYWLHCRLSPVTPRWIPLVAAVLTVAGSFGALVLAQAFNGAFGDPLSAESLADAVALGGPPAVAMALGGPVLLTLAAVIAVRRPHLLSVASGNQV